MVGQLMRMENVLNSVRKSDIELAPELNLPLAISYGQKKLFGLPIPEAGNDEIAQRKLIHTLNNMFRTVAGFYGDCTIFFCQFCM